MPGASPDTAGVVAIFTPALLSQLINYEYLTYQQVLNFYFFHFSSKNNIPVLDTRRAKNNRNISCSIVSVGAGSIGVASCRD